MNDVILGCVLGAFVCENSEVIGTTLHDWLKVCHLHLDERRQGDHQIRRLPLLTSPMMRYCGWMIGLRDLN